MNADDDELRQRINTLRHESGLAMLDCDVENSARLNAAADDLIVELAARTRAQTAVEPAAPDAGEQAIVDSRVSAINEAFNAHFGDLSPDEFADARALARARLGDPACASMSAAEFVQEIGGRVRRMQQQQPEHTAAEPAATRAEVRAPNVEALRRASAKDYVARRIERQFGVKR